ncbi:immunoglobulin-like domain-containing protein [Naumannella halotolerans]|uniref:Uncharacterized protein DUF5011 n=1 Tax=Naumannella halotolerans TaxID=993414 RepID=A0A4R7J517_9ACTN|nr:immunoglobulin-like domain-containing protein [Naumannella halotolerans]TDT32431.1 uncharacterized protein DUF5011 [Naumannella halotolerans]
MEWSGLTEGETYAWYAVSRDAETGENLTPGSITQMSVFTATAAGTDVTAPELTVPEGTEVGVGDDFDPLAGVSATDDTDGDLTPEVEVIGSVNTSEPGSHALTYTVQDTNGNQAISSTVVTVTEKSSGGSDDGDNGGADGGDGCCPSAWALLPGPEAGAIRTGSTAPIAAESLTRPTGPGTSIPRCRARSLSGAGRPTVSR